MFLIRPPNIPTKLTINSSMPACSMGRCSIDSRFTRERCKGGFSVKTGENDHIGIDFDLLATRLFHAFFAANCSASFIVEHWLGPTYR